MTCSRSGVKLWSLTAHPLLQVGSYTGHLSCLHTCIHTLFVYLLIGHSSVPFSCSFLKGGIYAATCDGSIHIWVSYKYNNILLNVHMGDHTCMYVCIHVYYNVCRIRRRRNYYSVLAEQSTYLCAYTCIHIYMNTSIHDIHTYKHTCDCNLK